MNEWHSLSFSAIILREIMDHPLEDETRQSRLKQVGMMNILYYMHVGRTPLTVTNIINETGLTRGGVTETIDYLVQRELLTETQVKNSMGRGRARQFEIVRRIFEKTSPFQEVASSQ